MGGAFWSVENALDRFTCAPTGSNVFIDATILF